jgi:hypothetical protein
MGVKISQLTSLLLAIIVSCTFSSTRELYGEAGTKQCSNSSGDRSDRQLLLQKLDTILKDSIPAYAQFPSRGFFVYDLNDPKNKYIPAQYAQADACISFINNHVYHFAPVEFTFSESHVVVLEDGQLKVFKAINCKDSNDHLTDVIAYVERRLKKDRNREELLTRLRDYRAHGFYMNTDSPRVPCETSEKQTTP